MPKPLQRRRPRRKSPAARAIPIESATPLAEQPTPSEASAPKPPRLSSPILTVERFECPTCNSVVPLQNVSSSIVDHPRVQALQRTIVIDCEACGTVTDAKLLLLNGVWSPESCEPRKRSA